ncbi:MAG: hypothetical protein U5R48_11495 [Gammaproteobacteria bacterium]|nr:hypothetical protein [Gammaproteobacteria bacterium]
MSSPHSIAREALDAAFAAAGEADIDEDRVTKALVPSCSVALACWPVTDVRSAVEFELERMGGDTEIEFMRP